MRVQGWDPVLIISQIICMQTIHYLTLALLVPPLLSHFTSPALLQYSGGSSTVGHILDWREMASRPTVSIPTTGWNINRSGSAASGDRKSKSGATGGGDGGGGKGGGGWRNWGGAWAGGKQVGAVVQEDEGMGVGMKGQHSSVEEELDEVWDFGVDDKRGWLLGAAWIFAAAIDIVPLYYLIRRPTYILDFSLTLNFNHLILTTYYAKSFPTSIFYWVVQALGALLMIVIGEQMCVRREMNTELKFGWDGQVGEGEAETIELNDRL